MSFVTSYVCFIKEFLNLSFVDCYHQLRNRLGFKWDYLFDCLNDSFIFWFKGRTWFLFKPLIFDRISKIP